MRLLPRLFTLLPAAIPAPLVSQSPAGDEWTQTVPRMETAEAQLAHARRLKGECAGKEGAALERWRALAVEAYQAVRRFHPEVRTACVEAAFRAGEILRAARDGARACAEFRWCAEHAEGSDLGARARLEIGHLMRHERRWREALEAFLDVAADARALAERREDAWLWAGSAWKAQGQLADARSAWQRVAAHGTDALARVRAYDELCLLLCESGDLEGAAGLLDECQRVLGERALEETETGERVRSALLRMRIVGALDDAIAQRRRAETENGSRRKP